MNMLRAVLRTFVAWIATASFIAVMTLDGIVPIAAAATCELLPSGTLIKVKGHTAVYLLAAKKSDAGYPFRKYFPNAEVFYSWFTDFSGVVEVDPSCIDDYQSGGGINFRPGSLLVKTEVSPHVYAVGPNNTKYLIPNEQVASALYGAKWASKVRILADAFDGNLKKGSALADDVPHNGMIIKKSSGIGLYFVFNGTYQEFDPDSSTLLAPWANTVSDAVFNKLQLSGDTVGKMDILKDPTQDGGLELESTGPKADKIPEVKTDAQDTETDSSEDVKIDTVVEVKTDSALDATPDDTLNMTKETLSPATAYVFPTFTGTSYDKDGWMNWSREKASVFSGAYSNLTVYLPPEKFIEKLVTNGDGSIWGSGISWVLRKPANPGESDRVMDRTRENVDKASANIDRIDLVITTDPADTAKTEREWGSAWHAAIKNALLSVDPTANGSTTCTVFEDPTFETVLTGSISFQLMTWTQGCRSGGNQYDVYKQPTYLIGKSGSTMIVIYISNRNVDVRVGGGSALDSAKLIGKDFLKQWVSKMAMK